MPSLLVLVDYDNVERPLLRAGPVAFARLLIPLIPEAVLAKHDAVQVRLYGGWRTLGVLTTVAQNLVPDIRNQSPAMVAVPKSGGQHQLRFSVELADGLIGLNAPLQETLAKDRDLRKFRSRRGWPECADSANCGFAQFVGVSYSTACGKAGCSSQLSDVLVRDEQKMVDTLIVADIAFQSLSQRASDIVVVSSDTDMWPGVLLALRSGCSVTHIHTRRGWKTQRHLLATLNGHALRSYHQLSV